MDWLIHFAAREIRTPEGAALVPPPEPEEERNFACDVGAAMYALANVLHAGCRKTIRRVIQGGTTFTVQFNYFIHHKKAYIATSIWIPNQRGCYRGIFRIECLEEMCSRVGKSLGATAEREMVRQQLMNRFWKSIYRENDCCQCRAVWHPIRLRCTRIR